MMAQNLKLSLQFSCLSTLGILHRLICICWTWKHTWTPLKKKRKKDFDQNRSRKWNKKFVSNVEVSPGRSGWRSGSRGNSEEEKKLLEKLCCRRESEPARKCRREKGGNRRESKLSRKFDIHSIQLWSRVFVDCRKRHFAKLPQGELSCSASISYPLHIETSRLSSLLRM